jgi:hypothetical protein
LKQFAKLHKKSRSAKVTRYRSFNALHARRVLSSGDAELSTPILLSIGIFTVAFISKKRVLS